MTGWPPLLQLPLIQPYCDKLSSGATVAERRSGRNTPCWCGSGKKYKKCHLGADNAAKAHRNMPLIPRAREYEELWRSVLQPPQVRSDEIGPDRH